MITDILDDDKTDPETGASMTLRKMPITEFAKLLNVSRETLRSWRNQIPDFWDRVNRRRSELAPQSRLQRVHETWYLRAVKGEWQHMEAWLMNFDPNYKTPKIKVEHDATDNYAALLMAASRDGVIEGEVVDAANQGTSGPDQPAHPNPS